MSTATLEQETKPVTNEAAIRQHIEAGDDYDDAIGDATGATPADYRHIKRKYQSRVGADRALKSEVVELDRMAAEAERIAEEAAQPLGDNVTLGEVRAKVHALLPDLPLGSHAQWAEGFMVFARNAHQLASKAVEAKRLAHDARNAAERVLLETCKVEPCPTLQGLVARRETLEKHIAECRETIRVANEDVPRQRAFVEQIARGGICPPSCRQYGLPRTAAVEKEFHGSEKKKLSALVAKAAGRDSAVAGIQAADRELEALQPKLLAAAETQRQRMLVPANMKWAAE